MMKRTALLLLAVIMVVSSVVCIPFAAGAEEILADSDEIRLLKGIGVLDDALDMRQPLTRGVYAEYTARLYGTVSPSTAASTVYLDVKADDSYCSAISLLTTYGLLNGCGDGNFHPERPITITEASKVLVDMLGYKYKANVYGGYPAGYNAAAQELGLFDGFDASQQYLYGKDFALMLYNALDVDIMTQNGIISQGGSTSLDFEKVKGRTILNENMDMYLEEGVIEANSVTNLTGVSVRNNQVVIDGTPFTVNDTQYRLMVGRYVEYVYYMPENSKERTLVYAYPKKGNEIALSKEDFISIDGFKIEYADGNGKIKKAKLSSDVDFVYNGRKTAFSQKLFNEFNVGEIRLIENTNDSDYDVVMIENYSSFVVDGINATQLVADDGIEQKHSLSFEPAKYDTMDILNADGKDTSFDVIAKGTVVSYFVNDGYLKAYITSDTADGKIDSIASPNGAKEYIIGGVKYKEPSVYTGDTADVGDEVTLYLDAFGYIADIKQGASDGATVGFLLQGKKIQKSMAVKYGFNIYTAQNKTIELYATERVEYNGVSTKIENMPDALPQSVICYRLNADGEVSSIETPVVREGADEGRLMTILPKQKAVYYSGMLDSKAVLGTSTVIFSVPEIEGDVTENMISTLIRSDLGDRKQHTLEGYALSASASRLKALLVYGGLSTSIPLDDNLATIANISHTLDEKDAEVFTIKVFVEGVAKEFGLADEIDGISSPSDFKVGDTFRYATNAEGKIHMIDMVYTVKDGWLPSTRHYYTDSEASAQTSVEYGKVIENDGDYIRLTFDDEPYTGFIQDYYALPISHYQGASVITLSPRGTVVTKGSLKDVVNGDYVINYRHLMSAVGFVVIKQE